MIVVVVDSADSAVVDVLHQETVACPSRQSASDCDLPAL